MISRLIVVLAALALGGLLAAAMLRDAGYVLIAYDGATLETSLWFAVAALLLIAAAAHVLGRLWRAMARGGARLGGAAARRDQSSLRARAQQGAMLLLESRWGEAERPLRETAPRLDVPLFGFVGAARAANEAGRFAARDAILDDAKSAAPDAAFVVDLARSELQQQAAQWQPSIATLTALREAAPGHPLVYARLLAAHQALGDHDAVAELASAAPAGAALGDEVRLWRAQLAKAAETNAPQGSTAAVGRVRRAWRAMPKALREQEDLVADHVDALVRHGAVAEAEALLRHGLAKHWHASWVRRYGTLPVPDAATAGKRLEAASAWLPDHPREPALLLALGQLAGAAGDAAQAERHLAACAALTEDADTLAALAALSEAAGDAAVGHLRRALAAR